jgi:hypothetical protein
MRQAGVIRNVADDRAIGSLWERNFCALLSPGTKFVRHQFGRTSSAAKEWFDVHGQIQTSPLPDVTVYHGFGRESSHEIKHKNATASGQFGLEAYRHAALMDHHRNSAGGCNYTIHDYDKSGGKQSMENDIVHWFTASFGDLESPDGMSSEWGSWIDGKWQKNVPMYFWNRSRFTPLAAFIEDMAEEIRLDVAFRMRAGRRLTNAH